MVDPNALQFLTQLTHLTYDLSLQRRQMDVERHSAQELTTPPYADPKRLFRHGFKVYSQSDEDGIIQEIFNRIGATARTFIEFGVETGIECNSVKLLVEGWSGLWIEGSAPCATEIQNHFGAFIANGKLRLSQNMVTAENINALFEQAGATGDIDLLSIDIDYNEYWVWKAIAAVKPRVVVIEYNATLRPPMSLVVPYDPARMWDGTNYFGASLEALVRGSGTTRDIVWSAVTMLAQMPSLCATTSRVIASSTRLRLRSTTSRRAIFMQCSLPGIVPVRDPMRASNVRLQQRSRMSPRPASASRRRAFSACNSSTLARTDAKACSIWSSVKRVTMCDEQFTSQASMLKRMARSGRAL